MSFFERLRAIVQVDPGNRGLARVPGRNLLTVCPEDLEEACRSLSETPNAALAVVTGFYIPTAKPPAGETDGPLGAVFLARALYSLGIRVTIVTDDFCARAVETGVRVCGLRRDVDVVTLPAHAAAVKLGPDVYRQQVMSRIGSVTHLLALERVGPSHTLQSLQEQPGREGVQGQTCLDFVADVPDEHQDRCHTMRGLDITDKMSPAHWLFEDANAPYRTLGVGDGGNEIGMGRIPWDVLRDNIPNGGLVACRVATERLIVCGVSNWGAYALASGVYHLRGKTPAPSVFNGDIERRILAAMVEQGPLVDGVSAQRSTTVDGLAWEAYAAVLERCREVHAV